MGEAAVNQYPNILSVRTVIQSASIVSTQLSDGRYVPARPIGWQSWHIRFRAAWLVFRGDADALVWESQ